MNETHFKSETNGARNELLEVGQQHGVSDFLALIIPLHTSIQARGLPRFGMGVLGTHGVDLDIAAISGFELLVDVRAVLADGTIG